jgi:geranylgeranyl diphosphate synthase type II
MQPVLNRTLKKNIPLIDKELNRLLPRSTATPQRLHDAMRYSIFAGGKRLRPILVMAAAEACGGNQSSVLPAACALEMVHTYSLIHDDLPAMDDDDLRRGRKTNHRVYGEAMAILAGDALLTHAFSLLAYNGAQKKLSPRDLAELIATLVRGAGTEGMIGGQVADVESESGRWRNKKYRFENLDPKILLPHIHARKTAALITSSLEIGARLTKAGSSKIKALRDYGHNIGLAFQVKDDILDRIGDKKKLGKKGSDEANNKLTFPALYGLEKSKVICEKLIEEAHSALKPFGNKAGVLHALADFIQDRDH